MRTGAASTQNVTNASAYRGLPITECALNESRLYLQAGTVLDDLLRTGATAAKDITNEYAYRYCSLSWSALNLGADAHRSCQQPRASRHRFSTARSLAAGIWHQNDASFTSSLFSCCRFRLEGLSAAAAVPAAVAADTAESTACASEGCFVSMPPEPPLAAVSDPSDEPPSCPCQGTKPSVQSSMWPDACVPKY